MTFHRIASNKTAIAIEPDSELGVYNNTPNNIGHVIFLYNNNINIQHPWNSCPHFFVQYPMMFSC